MGNKIIRWWKYSSIWKLFGIAYGTVLGSFLCAFFIPEIWNIISVVVICIIGGILIRKNFTNALKDFIKELK